MIPHDIEQAFNFLEEKENRLLKSLKIVAELKNYLWRNQRMPAKKLITETLTTAEGNLLLDMSGYLEADKEFSDLVEKEALSVDDVRTKLTN